MADVLRTGVSVREQEVHIERPDGLRGIALVDIEVVKDSGGNIVGAVNCFQDVTERKRGGEAALRLAAIIESSDDAIVSEDLDGTIRSWNGGAQRIFGYLAEEVIGKPIAILIPPDRHKEETAILERLRRGERIGSYETVRRHKDGSPIDVSLTVSPLKNTDGRVIGASKIARNITERLYAERALRESKARLQTAAELVGLGWSYWKPGCSDVEWDARLKAIWGLSPGALVDLERATAAIHPDDRPKVDEIRAALTNPAINSYKAEYRVIGIEDGVERWIRTRGRTYEPGNPKAFVSGVLDITEQKRTEQTLRDKEARLQAAVDLVGLSVYSWDLWAGTVEWDDRTKALWGLPPEAEVDLALARSAIHPDDLPRLDASIAQAKDPQGEGIFRVEFRVIGINDGLERWVSSYGKTTFVDGKARGFVGAVREITQEKRAEVRLRESEARLQAAVDLVKLGRYAWNPQTNELQWDDTLRAMWGLPAGAPVDYEVWRTGAHPDDLASVEAAIQRCTDPRGDGVYEIEYRVIGKTDGVERWIGTRGQTNFENNVPVSFFGVALEVTDRKRIERRLERRVEDRTRELAEANRELRSQMEKREIAEAEVQQLQRLDAVGQITSGVAHDFNNLLSVVLTNVRLLSRTVRSADDQEGIELIRTAADRGAKLIAQLLAFSRQQRLEPHEVDLNSKIIGMSNLLSATLGGTVQLRTTFSPDLWPAWVDPNQIELIVLNLAINARDAMQPGGTLTLETFNTIIESEPFRPEEPSPGDYVGLAVKDTGSGIPNDVLPHVFEPFFTTKEPGKGSGLGLAQVFGFAKQSGGGVRLETRLGQGTAV
ncbi:MAG: PAS domain S-box protein, partial [Bradyrhizobium sp.]